ncbi:MAG: winged helix-turn-helix transcriptional regulator [Anaerolineae bacterium]|nr:winged helix-turn-helix transcriptional regulator [Anaerolineae bacterium]
MDVPENQLAADVLHKFLLVYRHLRQYHRQMDSESVRPRHAAVLRFLIAQGPATVGDVQAHLYTSASTASAIISQLEEAGQVTRARSPDDNRVVIVTITDAGRDIVARTPLGGIGLLRQRLDDLPAEQLQQMDEALAEIMHLMEVPCDR